MKTAISKSFLCFSPITLMLACASTGPTPELVDARRAYEQAQMSEAQRLAPDRLLSAKQALDAAERAHKDDAGSSKERSYAYVAQRRAQLAAEYGEIARLRNEQQTAEKNYSATQDRLRRSAQQRADASQGQLSDQRGKLASTQNELAVERQARVKAEQRASAALDSLQQVARVKEESRGTVITLDGAVLFVSGKAELLPIAQQKLNDVAEALKQTEDQQAIKIEGYTDSRGSDETNLKLSQQRADAVRSYLVARGVKPERVTAEGKGEQNPIASNDTAEGRANNRRVEIIVQSQAGAQATPSRAPSTMDAK
ncbi:MAG TPA: OmpA family protein [Polyangiaceae bacterium]|nr:OmpA family protein [Polyangiaceae bacterium]